MRKLLAGLGLLLGFGLGAAAPAVACFNTTGGGDCITVVITWCSYNQDGTGGLYIAHIQKLVNVNC